MESHAYRRADLSASRKPPPDDWNNAREVRIRELARQLGELVRRVDLLTKQRDEAFRQLLEMHMSRGTP